MKVYSGYRHEAGNTASRVTVIVDGHSLSEGFQYVNHSPDGFNWGYAGSGPSQLAFAIMHDYFKGQGLTPKEAYEKVIGGLYQEFKFDFVAHWSNQWQITEEEITNWLKEKVNERD